MSLPRMSDMDDIGGVPGADSLREAEVETFESIEYFWTNQSYGRNKYGMVSDLSDDYSEECLLTSQLDEPLL